MSSEEPGAYGDAETRRRILEATWKIIEEHGSSVRLVDVADKAGVSRQAIYLHFGDRAGLLLALVQYMPQTLGFQERLSHVLSAPTGAEMLKRAVELHSTYHARIDSVAQVLEAAQYRDDALGAAWRDRMNRSRAVHRAIVQRIADDGDLAEGWTVDEAGDLFYTVTMQGPWRELTQEIGWTPRRYAENVTRLLLSSFVRGHAPKPTLSGRAKPTGNRRSGSRVRAT